MIFIIELSTFVTRALTRADEATLAPGREKPVGRKKRTSVMSNVAATKIGSRRSMPRTTLFPPMKNLVLSFFSPYFATASCIALAIFRKRSVLS